MKTKATETIIFKNFTPKFSHYIIHTHIGSVSNNLNHSYSGIKIPISSITREDLNITKCTFLSNSLKGYIQDF